MDNLEENNFLVRMAKIYVSNSFLVMQEVLENSVNILADIPEEAVFPLIEFGGKLYI